MHPEIQFGDVEESQPERHARPDRDRHYAVASVGPVHERDLAVFVDLDALRDMEWHALSDTDVELGGVLLGGQYLDDEEMPFVLITDNLRAHHYEATKGSFKFTHETWEQITREREAFSEETQIVGWYHTHPGWGVFLSGMDMFICDHFFNRPLDVALVIDPCRQDRGFFQWDEHEAKRTRRTSAFYLIASRFRQQELESYADFLEGQLAMPHDPRTRGAISPAPYSAPVVHVTEPRSGWQTLAVMGSLTVQCCLLVLLAWKLLAPAAPSTDEKAEKQWAAIAERLQTIADTRNAEVQMDGKIEVLDHVVAQLGEGERGVVRSLAARTAEANEMRASVRSHMALENQLDSKIDHLENQLRFSDAKSVRLGENLRVLTDEAADQKEQIADLKEQLDQYQDSDDASEKETFWSAWHGALLGIGAAFLVLLVSSTVAALLRRNRPIENHADTPDDSEDSPNKSPETK